jgi:hypothetical protein
MTSTPWQDAGGAPLVVQGPTPTSMACPARPFDGPPPPPSTAWPIPSRWNGMRASTELPWFAFSFATHPNCSRPTSPRVVPLESHRGSRGKRSGRQPRSRRSWQLYGGNRAGLQTTMATRCTPLPLPMCWWPLSTSSLEEHVAPPKWLRRCCPS